MPLVTDCTAIIGIDPISLMTIEVSDVYHCCYGLLRIAPLLTGVGTVNVKGDSVIDQKMYYREVILSVKQRFLKRKCELISRTKGSIPLFKEKQTILHYLLLKR